MKPLKSFFWPDLQYSVHGAVNPEQLYKVQVFQGVFLDAGLVIDSTSQLWLCSLTFLPSVPRLYLGFSWPSAPLYLPWFAHIAHLSSSSPSLVPFPSIFSVYVAFPTSMSAHLITYRSPSVLCTLLRTTKSLIVCFSLHRAIAPSHFFVVSLSFLKP